MHFVSIGSIFKNEAHILREWIETHLREGIEHFYLIDNGSTDNPKAVLQPYIDRGCVTYFYDASPHNQPGLYHHYLHARRHESEWWVIIDLDEIVYGNAEAGVPAVAEYLRKLEGDVGCVVMPWTTFGTREEESQPASVVKSFQMREDLDTRITWTINLKSIVRGRAAINFGVHHSMLLPGYRYIDSNGMPSSYTPAMSHSEEYHKKCGIRFCHYVIQSWEWFQKVKMTRGDACSGHNVRDRKYFDEAKERCGKVHDDGLYRKHQDLYDAL